jgi:hypothetical protein
MLKATALVTIFAAVSAAALQARNIRIDGPRKKLVVQVLRADCNHIFPQLIYMYSNKRIDGPHHYQLRLAQTKMHCPDVKPRMVEVEVNLPNRFDGDEVVIHDQIGAYTYRNRLPLQSQNLTARTKAQPVPMEIPAKFGTTGATSAR